MQQQQQMTQLMSKAGPELVKQFGPKLYEQFTGDTIEAKN